MRTKVDPERCAVAGCGGLLAFGARLCAVHLDQVESIQSESVARSVALAEKSDDPYDVSVSEFMSAVGESDQMRSLAAVLVESGMQDAVEAFPSLSQIPHDVLEQLSAFMSVSLVSSVIQDRAHFLARAKMLQDALPKEQAEGVRHLIAMELDSLSKEIELVSNR